jgi:hypothetical protein
MICLALTNTMPPKGKGPVPDDIYPCDSYKICLQVCDYDDFTVAYGSDGNYNFYCVNHVGAIINQPVATLDGRSEAV